MKEITCLEELKSQIALSQSLQDCALQDIDLISESHLIRTVTVDGCFFLGCKIPDDLYCHIQESGGYIFPKIPHIPYSPFRKKLYSASELFDQFSQSDPCTYCDCSDALVYKYWKDKGGAEPRSIVHGILQKIHDQSISDAMYDFLDLHHNSKVIAIMGGHSMKRDDKRYRDLVYLSRELTNQGCLMVSGGGPGAMEATHVGAMFAKADEPRIESAISLLSQAPSYKDHYWLKAAFHVIESHTSDIEPADSLGIPTWHYGHEPPNPFASHIAKYFSNSIREEGLITIAHDGIIYAPGSAGTIQEIFQDAAQNHYTTTGYASPMIFLDKHFWEVKKPVYPILNGLAENNLYSQNLGIVDSVEEVIQFLDAHGKIKSNSDGWSFCSTFCQQSTDESIA